MPTAFAPPSPAVSHPDLRQAGTSLARRQVEDLTAYLASIVESCGDAIVGKTLDGIVVSWNGGAERLYGYTAGEMIGTPITRLFPPYRPDELPDLMQRIKRGEHVESYETVRLRKDGSPIDVSLTISPVRDPATGEIIGASTVARDITRIKREEQERLSLIRELTEALNQAGTNAVKENQKIA